MPRRLALVLMVLPTLACASLRGRVLGPSEAETRYQQAMAALDRADFQKARTELAWLVGRCEAGERGREAVLLLASAELDVRNPSRSPQEAAHLAEAYLRQPWLDEDHVPLARSLYLLSLDLGARPTPRDGAVAESATAPGDSTVVTRVRVAERFNHCDGGGVADWAVEPPEHTGTTTAHRLAALADSLATVRRYARIQADTIEALEAELERIRKLLRGGRTPGTRPPG